MNTLFLSDGSSVELPEYRLKKFLVMLTHRGIKSVRFGDDIVVVSPSNLIRIELGVENENDERSEDRKTVEPVAVQTVAEGTEGGERDGTDGGKDEPVAESMQARKDRILAEMKEKSDCAGNGHIGKEQIIHYQDVTIRRKNAKDSLPSRRYFPVCSFCGLRQKYVKADTLSDEQKENAKFYEVK